MLPLLFCLAVGLTVASNTYAGQRTGADNVERQKPTTWQPSQTRSIELFPAGDIFPVYAADPHRPTNHLAVGFHSTTDIPETSSPRTTLSAGGRFGILRIDSSTPAGRSWQISLDAGLDAVFDSPHSNDGIGWDGNYGLTVTTTTEASRFAFKLAVLHASAHLGDEYEARSHASRLNYTREELAVAAAWRPRSSARVYPIAFKLAVLHASAHLGDEYEARTHASRLNYTREELAVAAAWRPRSSARVAELGVAYLMR